MINMGFMGVSVFLVTVMFLNLAAHTTYNTTCPIHNHHITTHLSPIHVRSSWIKQRTKAQSTRHRSSAMTKSKKELQAELLALGEVAPEKWTLTELRVRIAELKEEQGLDSKRKKRTPLQEWVVRLNAASKKKAELQKFLHEYLGLPVAENATILMLQKQAMEKIYQISGAHGTDPVGFGAHSSLTYEEVQKEHKGYCQWVVTTSQEGQSSARLQRLANWLIQNPESPEGKTLKVKAEDKQQPPPEVNKPEDAVSTGSVTSAQLVSAMQQMMAQMAEMKEDLDNLQNRPHKKSAKDEEMEPSTNSWSPVLSPVTPEK